MREIDTSFDVRTDAGGKDPDRYSPTLRRYHQALWSKPLPGGAEFTLDAATPGAYLHHSSPLGEFELSSDSIVHPYDYWKRTAALIAQIPQADLDDFNFLGSTIGAFLVFPSNTVNGQTINGARGINRKIDDRIDLTLEAIRRHYQGGTSPLSSIVASYSEFFSLFGDFEGYVQFFCMDDLVSKDGSVKFFLPFDDFKSSPLPSSPEEYQSYRAAVSQFVRERNDRIGSM
jgi:hypothetical protein